LFQVADFYIPGIAKPLLSSAVRTFAPSILKPKKVCLPFLPPDDKFAAEGRGMARANHRNQTGWRRLTGWLAAYLLVLHVAFAGAATGHFFVPSDDAVSGAIFCLNDTNGSSSPADLPAHPSHGKVHCVLCSGGGSLALSSANVFSTPRLALASALVPASEQAPGPSRRHSPNQSRAPPLEV
jgi:hypothetical protein